MDIITTAVYFGIASVIIMFLFNIFHCILAGIFGVRVEIFAILLAIGNTHFLKYKRNYTEFNLGWIPTGGYVKIAGMFDESIDGQSAIVEDYMLLSKSPIVRFICTAGTPLLLLIPFIISASFIVPNGSLNEGFQVLNDVIYNIYSFVIGAIDSTQMEANWNMISMDKNIFPIILCWVTLVTAFASISTLLGTVISKAAKKLHDIGSILFLLFYLYIFYKIIVLYFSLNGFLGGLIHLFKFTITIYILSFVLMLLIKILPKNKYI